MNNDIDGCKAGWQWFKGRQKDSGNVLRCLFLGIPTVCSMCLSTNYKHWMTILHDDDKAEGWPMYNNGECFSTCLRYDRCVGSPISCAWRLSFDFERNTSGCTLIDDGHGNMNLDITRKERKKNGWDSKRYTMIFPIQCATWMMQEMKKRSLIVVVQQIDHNLFAY